MSQDLALLLVPLSVLPAIYLKKTPALVPGMDGPQFWSEERSSLASMHLEGPLCC